MDDIFIYLLLAFFILLIFKKITAVSFGDKNRLGIKGKLIWMDKGKHTKPFFNHAFQIMGKPDLMYKVDGGILAVEYKSRKGWFYFGDVIQAQTAALAARGNGYNVTQILVKTATTEKYFDLPKQDYALYKKIKYFVRQARKAKKGCAVEAVPRKRKCSKCAFHETCLHKA